ncbi:uncharacterized protein LOC117333703 [Pecten maximus]|uniref:uncharacterized protein LOC117333703 n=1 Tax=Pecten maximus TaxID=6579 RepID=UPI0014587F29|nr:uncharacterized protein LOC117333703 [Pecten maximus]
MKRKQQMVGLAKPCRKRSIILHEIGHAIGMFHEQARPDRDEYISILYNHILPPVRFNFQKIDPEQTTNYSIAYDYLSIMHYGETAFSFNRSAITMKAGNPSFQKKMGKATRISFRDVMSVNKMYNCAGHCTVKPNCPFKEAFVGKDCRCWCPTDENDREPAKLCPTAPPVDPPRINKTQTSNRRPRPNQSQREANGVLLKIAFNPNRRQISNGAASAVLTPVGRGHSFIRNPSDQGARMVPTSGSEGSESLAATLSNLPSSIRIGSLGANGERPVRSRSRNIQSRNLALGRRTNFFRRLPSPRSQRPSTTESGNRLEQQLAKELNKLNGVNSGTISRPSRRTPLLSGLMPTRQSGSDMNSLVSNAVSVLTGGRRGNTNRNTNGAVVSSQTPGGGVATSDLKQLLQELRRLNNQNQMSTQNPIVGNVRHTHVRSRPRHLMRELSDLRSQTGPQQRPHLSEEQMSYLLQKFPSFSSPSVTHTHPVVMRPSSGHNRHHHNHHNHHHHNEHQHNGILSPITSNTHFHTNP